MKGDKEGGMQESVFDLSKGGHLTRWTSKRADRDPEATNTFEWAYVQVNGVWVPGTYMHTHRSQNPDGTLNQSIKRVEFERQAVNEPIDSNEFTIEALGVIRGTRVSDNVVGIAYEYGKTPGGPAAEDLGLEALAQAGPFPTEVNVPAGPNSVGRRVPNPAQADADPPGESPSPVQPARPGGRSGWLAVGLGCAVLVVVLAVICASRRRVRKQ